MNNKRKRNATDKSSMSTNDSLLLSECKVLLTNQSKESFVWMYFGQLVLKNGEQKVEQFSDKYVCNRCIQIESEHSNGLKLLTLCNIKSYAKSVSTGNLASHLHTHGIKQHKSFDATTRTLDTFFNTNLHVRRTIPNSKFMLIRDLVLLCCKDLFAFNLVSGEGLRDFFLKYKIIVSDDDMPCRTSIGRALNEIYQDCKSYVINRIKNECPDLASMTFDMWSDKHRRRSYITFTLHYIDKEFRMINLTLATIHFPERHTGVNIHSEIEKLIFEFGLEGKTIYMVTDAGSNCRLACEIGSFDNLLCLGHGLHNAITKDGFEQTPSISKLITKVKKIVKALRYRTSRFEKLSKDQHALALEMSKLSEDLLMFYDEDFDDEPTSTVTEPMTLKLDVSTRWHSQLTMIESLTCQNKNVINVMLESIDKGELALNQTDYSLLNELCRFLKHFKKITEVLCGDQYPTINYVVLFRSELRALLDVEPQDSTEIKNLKRNIENNFDHRFPLLEIHIVSALLDPRFQNLHEVKVYLKDNNITAKDLLMRWVEKTGVGNNHRTTVQNIQVETQSYVVELVERHSTLSSLRDSTSMSAKSQCERECYLLLSMGGKIEIENILDFWKNQSDSMSRLANLALRLLSIPVTSTPSERNFSIAGIIIDSKRSRLSPDSLDHILFIHNNYRFIKEVTFTKDVNENDKLVS